MTRRLVISPQAWRDVDVIVAYIADRSPASAARFLDAAWDAFVSLAETPGAGVAMERNHPRLGQIRKWAINGYLNYLVFYRATGDSVQIVRVLHGARDLNRVIYEET